MTQRNPMNPRTQNKSYKGVSKKSASSAKPVRQAGASVRTISPEVKEKQQRKANKEMQREEQRKERDREAVLGAEVTKTATYKKWRRNWLITLVVAIVCIALSWAASALSSQGTLPADLFGTTAPVNIVLIIIGYGGLIGAVVIDFKKIRPLRKAAASRASTLSKKERQELDRRIEQSRQQEAAAREARAKSKSDKASRLPWNKKDDGAAGQGEEDK